MEGWFIEKDPRGEKVDCPVGEWLVEVLLCMMLFEMLEFLLFELKVTLFWVNFKGAN